MRKNIAKLLKLSILPFVVGGIDLSKINFGEKKPILDISGNLIYGSKKLNDPEFINFLSTPTNKNFKLPDKNYNFLNYSFYQISGKTEDNNLSVKDYLTQKFTAIQALKDSIDFRN